MISETSKRASLGYRTSRREGDLLIRRLVYIAFFLETGLLLIFLPWSSFWSRNYFVAHWPALTTWLVNDFVRGAVTGLGVVNIAAGIADLRPVLSRDRDTSA